MADSVYRVTEIVGVSSEVTSVSGLTMAAAVRENLLDVIEVPPCIGDAS